MWISKAEHQQLKENSENLLREVLELKQKNAKLLTVQGVIEHILDRPIEWIDTSRMDETARTVWQNEALALLRNQVFISLCGQTKNGVKTNGEVVKNLIEHIARYAKDNDEMNQLRMTINGIELVRQYAEDLVAPKSEETFDNLHDTI